MLPSSRAASEEPGGTRQLASGVRVRSQIPQHWRLPVNRRRIGPSTSRFRSRVAATLSASPHTSSGGQASTGSDQSQFVVQKATTGPQLVSLPIRCRGGRDTHRRRWRIYRRGDRVRSASGGVQLKVGQSRYDRRLRLPVSRLPEYAAFGESSLLATGATSKSQASDPIDITNSWDDPGRTQGHGGFEPNDASYSNIFVVSPKTIGPAWNSIAGSAITTSAAVADGVAYVGDASGQLLAIDTHNGAVLWTWQDPSGNAIDGAPTVDPALGLVMVSSANGTVDGSDHSGDPGLVGHRRWGPQRTHLRCRGGLRLVK